MDDPGRELLLETVILCVFQTDAAWFVLSYLLSPEVVKASQVRTTASILSNLHSWVPMDKVVAVLRVLLEPQRRWALRVSLHKSIVRMLFEAAANAEARDVFLHEWAARDENRMHADVLYEMVRLAVAALASPEASPKLDVAWRLVSEVARSQPGAFSPATLLLLLLPTFSPPLTFARQNPSIDSLLRIDVPKSELPDSFGFLHHQFLGEAPVPFAAPAVRERLIGELRALASTAGRQNAYLRVAATCKVFTLSPCVTGQEEYASLDELQELLLAASVRWSSPPPRAWEFPKDKKLAAAALSPEDEYLLQVAPRVFAFLALQVVSKAMEAYTEHERHVGTALERLCEGHPAAARLRSLMAKLLEALARAAPIEAEKRVRLAHVARGLMATARGWGPEVGKALFSDHFHGELAFLRGDLGQLTSALGL